MSEMRDDTTPAVDWPRIASILTVLVALIIAAAAIHSAATLFVPLFVAFLITVVVAPYQARLIKAGISRATAYLMVLVPTVLALLAIVAAVDLSLSAFIADLPSYEPGSRQLVQDVLGFGARVGLDLTHVVRTASAVRHSFLAADALTRSLLTASASWTIVLLLTIFMIYEALDYPEKLADIVRSDVNRTRLSGFVSDLSRYIRIVTLAAALTAIGDFVILLALGVPSAPLWAGLAFLFSYIPNVGSIMIALPPTIATLVRFGAGRALAVGLLLLIVDNVVGIVVVPRLVGQRLNIAPFWGMLSLVVWGWLLGPAGAVLAIPLTLMLKFLLESTPATEPLGRLMSVVHRKSPDRPSQGADTRRYAGG